MEFSRLFDIFPYQQKNNPQEKSLGHRVGNDWVYYSSDEVMSIANSVSLGLLKLGVKPGDKIAVISYKNRPEWNMMDVGMGQIGAINVPVYPTISPSEYEYIFNDAGISYCFVSMDGAGDLLSKVRAIKDKVPTLKEIYTFDRVPDAPYWEDIFEGGDMKEVEEIMAGIKPEDLATIIYTSGTTGNPKGVMLSHNNIVSNVKAVFDHIPLGGGDIALSFLPLCHIFERTVTYCYISKGVNITYTGTDNLGGETGDLATVKPHFFTTVPRLLEKVYEKIYNKGLALTGLKKKLFFWALSLTDDYKYDAVRNGFKYKVADKLIFSKWREALGGNIKGIFTGAAACPAKMAKVFSAAGVPIREGYGLTETSPALAINRYTPYDAMLGTVGLPLPGVDIMIDESDPNFPEGEGEILAKGPNIMMGYYNKPDATAAVFSERDGVTWFHTGDVGRILPGKDGRQFVKITDRKKELLKTSGGKYVAPQPIESLFKEDFLIEQMMVVGEKRKFVSALIVPAEEALKDYCKHSDIDFTTMAAACKDERVIAHFQSIIDGLNPKFSKIEQIKKFVLVPDNWDVSTGELTPTMKLKRRVIRENYDSIIEEIYNV